MAVNKVDQQLTTRNDLLNQLKANLHATNNRMQQTANASRRHVEFQEGVWVFLQLQPYRQQTVFKQALQKLACRFFGPYQIEEKISQVAYRLKLPYTSSCIHPVFHVSLLKKKIG